RFDVLETHARQLKTDFRRNVASENSIGEGIGRWAMRDHGKAVLRRRKLLCFFVNRSPRTPVPCLMDERPVCGVHQADDRMVHGAAKKLCFAELRLCVSGKRNPGWIKFRDSMVLTRSGHVNPQKTVLLTQRIALHADARWFEVLSFDERGNGTAGPVGAKTPAVIGT